MKTSTLVILPIVFYVALYVAEVVFTTILPKHYIFDHVVLQNIVKESLNSLEIDASAAQVMDKVYEKLVAEYGKFIEQPEGPKEWVFNNAGGAMGSMTILHASLSEYLIFFGTAVGTEGHSGTHYADDYFIILYGEELAGLPNATTAERYLPGDVHHLPYGINKQYAMPSGSFALELAQGYIPSMLPFGFIQMITSTLDYKNFGRTVYFTAVQMIRNLYLGKV